MITSWIFFNLIFSFMCSYFFIIILGTILVIYFMLFYFIFDKKRIKSNKNLKDPQSISIEILNEKPLVNIIVPAWNEGFIFSKCLESIKNLKYPNIKAIVNAGGNKETLQIANDFKKYDNFIILHQEKGSIRASIGKVRAINDCLKYVKEGIVYFIDADSYLDDEILLQMIYPIINKNEKIVLGGLRPLKEQENRNFVKYLFIDRFRANTFRYSNQKAITGANWCIAFEVLKSINKFSENEKIATDKSMGNDVFSKGYEGYLLANSQHRIYVDYPNNFKKYKTQKSIWIENTLYNSVKNRKFIGFLKFLLLWIFSVYLFIFPFLFFFNIGFFYIGIFVLILYYLGKIRKYLIFRALLIKEYRLSIRFNIQYFISLFLYLYIEALITIYILFHFFFYLKKLNKK